MAEPRLTHLDDSGAARMVDVSDKPVTSRSATASGSIWMAPETLRVIVEGEARKGDVLALSGSTGRVTGAHLHWGARLANARIDPLELLRKISSHWQPAPQSKTPAIEMEK